MASSGLIAGRRGPKFHHVLQSHKVPPHEACAVAQKIYALSRASADVATALRVQTAVRTKWEDAHREFAEACKSGRDAADDRVEQALLSLCTGYDTKMEAIRFCKGQVVRQEYT
jgi:hypothetical protein